MMIDRYSAYVGDRASISKHDWRHIFDEMKDHNIEQNSIDSKASKAYYQSVQFFIEEPEQNLFPMSQKDLVLNIVKHIISANRNEKARQRSMVVITTHSPYVLSVMNVLMAEAKLYDKHYENYIEGVDDVVDYDCYMPSDYYSAYFINDNGTFNNLIDSELPMISGLELDGVSDWVEERISKVNEFIYRVSVSVYTHCIIAQ